MVSCGVYREHQPLVVRRSMSIIAAKGCQEPPSIETRRGPLVVFNATHGVIAGFQLVQHGGSCKEGWPCSVTGKADTTVDIRGGALVLRGCDIRSVHGGGVRVSGGAAPLILSNRIIEAQTFGIMVSGAGARGVIDSNVIRGCRRVGVQIENGAYPLVTRNTIKDGAESGVVVCEGGAGVIEGNHLAQHGLSSVEIDTGANPCIRKNNIHGSGQAGVFVHDHGRGRIEDNEIVGSRLAGVEIASGGAPIVRHNHIKGSHGPGVLVQAQGGGVVEDNDIVANPGMLMPNGCLAEGQGICQAAPPTLNLMLESRWS